jgi:actin related protein 2/3 complex subunit 3
MPGAYHSSYNAAGSFPELCGLPVLPLKTKIKGPAPCVELPGGGGGSGAAPPEEEDVVDEALRFFRANVMFRNFELQGGGDKLLVYLTLFIHLCLKRAKPARAEGARELQTLASGNHLAPGDAGWPLAQIVPAPKGAEEGEALRGYLRQLRECVVARLLPRIYQEDGALNKHWAVFGKRKGFMGREFP